MPKLKEFLLFQDHEEAKKGAVQTPDEQLAYVKGWLMPYFEAQEEFKKDQVAKGIIDLTE